MRFTTSDTSVAFRIKFKWEMMACPDENLKTELSHMAETVFMNPTDATQLIHKHAAFHIKHGMNLEDMKKNLPNKSDK